MDSLYSLNLPILVLSVVGGGVLSLGLYRALFHPLARFPGPKLAGATYWYSTYYEVFKDGAFVEHLEELHKLYGPVVRITPSELHFNTPQAYMDIYAKGIRFTKDPRFYGALHADESTFGMLDPQVVKARRDIVLPLFSRRAILELENVVLRKVQALITEVLKYEKAPVNMHRAYRAATLDIILSYCFAKDHRVVHVPGFTHQLLLDFEMMFPILLILKNFRWLWYILMFIGTVKKTLFDSKEGRMADMEHLISEQVDELLADPQKLAEAEHETIYHHLLTPHPEKGVYGKVPSRKSLTEEGKNVLSAGSDTVANTTTMGTCFILSHPEVNSRLVEELKEAWPDKETEMRYTELEKLPYLTAVIKESLRMSHGVVLPPPRVVGPTDAVIDGVAVPAGAVVSMGSTFMHYNPDIFPDPYTFNPDRWLQPDSANLDQHLVAFSRGPRSCTGQNLAWCEFYLIFGYMFRMLDMELHDTTLDDMKFKCHFIPTTNRMLHCIVRARES